MRLFYLAIFLHELYRRLSRVSIYKSGSVNFAYSGISYLKNILGPDGIAKFIARTGGIDIDWVNTRAIPPRMTRYWPISPRDKVRDILENDTQELEHLGPEKLDYISQTDVVTGAWTQSEPVTPKVHCELQLILCLEEKLFYTTSTRFIAIGTSTPMCWACHYYIKRRKSLKFGFNLKWKLSQTSGKARDDWCLPPGDPSLGDAMLECLGKEVPRVVEEYAQECCP